MLRYPVTLTPDGDTLLVTAPDLPEVTTFGEDEADALVRAADAIATALQGRIAARQAIPAPSMKEGPSVQVPALTWMKLLLHRAMLDGGIRKAELGRRLGVHQPQIDRLLDLDHDSRIDQIEAALKACGLELLIETRAA